MNKRTGWVYGLFDIEEPERIRYAGKTISTLGVPARVYQHLWSARKLKVNVPSAHWIRKIGSDRVGYVILEETTSERVNETEIRWIADLRSRGMADLNITVGGDGQTSEQVSGEGNPRAKITWEMVRSIRDHGAATYTRTSEIAQNYGLTPAAVSKILRNVSWYDPGYDPNVRLGVIDINRTSTDNELVWRTLTDSKVEELRELYLSGVSISDIIRRTKQPSTSIRRALFEKYGSEESRRACIEKRGPVRKIRKDIPEGVKRLVIQRYHAGETQSRLSKEFGISQSAISLWVHHDRLK